jgi:hypothetical protein
MSAHDWTNDNDEVIRFARGLDSAGALEGSGGAIDYFAKPHKWTNEHRRWIELGRPSEHRDHENAWDVILDLVSLSPEAEELLSFHDGLGVPTTRDPDAAQELADAGIIRDFDDGGLTAIGRVYVEINGAIGRAKESKSLRVWL